MANVTDSQIDILKLYKMINQRMSTFVFPTANAEFIQLMSDIEKFIDNDNIILGNKPKKLKLLISKKYKGILKGLHPDKEKTENILHEKDGDEKYNFIDNGGYSSIKKSKNDTTKEVYITNVKLGDVINDSNFSSLYSELISRVDHIYLNDIKVQLEELMEFYLVIHTVQDITLNIKNSQMRSVFPELYSEPLYKDDEFKNYAIKLYENNKYFTITDRLSRNEMDNYVPYTVDHYNNDSGALYTNVYGAGFGNNTINMGNLKELQNQKIIQHIIEDHNLISLPSTDKSVPRPIPPPLPLQIPTPSPSVADLDSPTNARSEKKILNKICACIK